MSEFQEWLSTQVIEDAITEALEEFGIEPTTDKLKAVWLEHLYVLYDSLSSAAERVAEQG